jgi:hypothetical protein
LGQWQSSIAEGWCFPNCPGSSVEEVTRARLTGFAFVCGTSASESLTQGFHSAAFRFFCLPFHSASAKPFSCVLQAVFTEFSLRFPDPDHSFVKKNTDKSCPDLVITDDPCHVSFTQIADRWNIRPQPFPQLTVLLWRSLFNTKSCSISRRRPLGRSTGEPAERPTSNAFH